jgi:hypothetical protein
MALLRDKLGFRDYPDAFEINEGRIDETYETEGFVTVAPDGRPLAWVGAPGVVDQAVGEIGRLQLVDIGAREAPCYAGKARASPLPSGACAPRGLFAARCLC